MECCTVEAADCCVRLKDNCEQVASGYGSVCDMSGGEVLVVWTMKEDTE
jgi:hypothetical protein